MNRASRTSRNAVGENAQTPDQASGHLSKAESVGGARFGSGSSDASRNQELQIARELLDRGALSQAEEKLRRLTNQRGGDAKFIAEARRLLSVALEAQSRHREAQEAVAMYESAVARENLDFDTAMRLRVQIASAYKGVGDQPKAITLLQVALREASERGGADAHLGAINANLANVYRSLNEFRIARDYAHAALEHFRHSGDWRALAGVYLTLGIVDGREGHYEDAVRNLNRVIELVGEETAPHLLGAAYASLSGVCWYLKRPHESIGYSEKAINFYQSIERKFDTIVCYNNLGINLTLIGDWTRAEQVFGQALAIGREMEGRTQQVILATVLDSLSELCILRGDIAMARGYLDEAQRLAAAGNHKWYAVQVMSTSSRCYLAMRDVERAASDARQALELALHIGDRQAIGTARLLIAEACLLSGAIAECRPELEQVERAVTSSVADLPISGGVQLLRGRLALAEGDETLAAHHFHRYHAICEMADDRYHTAQAHAELGAAYTQGFRPHRAAHHLALAAHIFRMLGARVDLVRVEGHLKQLDLKQADSAPDPVTNAHLLTLRLTEASVSRELLLRELAAICYAETRADAVMLVEPADEGEPRLLVAHGSTNAGSKRLAKQLHDAWTAGEAEAFAERQGARIVSLGGAGVPPALLLVAPADVAEGEYKTFFDTLLRITELGLETYVLRDRANIASDAEAPQAAAAASVMPGFIHTSPAMTRLVEEVTKIRSSDVTVLVTGESGTGKELVARLVHTLSTRREKTFVPFNCTAVPKELSEAYLFGYRRGAFTGATADSTGVIRAAEGGTLFLDEVGDLPLDVQPKLLRFLQEGEIQPLGEQRPIKTDVRIVAATNSDLERAVSNGRFREDLYYRLNVIRLLVPPLRDRRSEIPALVNHYIEHYGAKFGRRGLRISEQAMELLEIADWGGNIRQLCNEVQRFVALAEEETLIIPEHLSPEVRRALPATLPDTHAPRAASPLGGAVIPLNVGAAMLRHTTLANAVGDLEQRMIADAMQRHAGNISRVARELGLTRRGLYLKLERYGFETSG